VKGLGEALLICIFCINNLRIVSNPSITLMLIRRTGIAELLLAIMVDGYTDKSKGNFET